jgi:hypothetical protein
VNAVYKRKCVFTVIAGDYDYPPPVPDNSEAFKDFDFFCFSDRDLKCSDPWRLVRLDSDRYDAVLLSRDVKFRSHDYMPWCDMVVYIDGNVGLNAVFSFCINSLHEDEDCLFLLHPERKSLLEECVACYFFTSTKLLDIIRHLSTTAQRGYNDSLPLTANRVFVRRHSSHINSAFESLFQSFKNGPFRDQLHLQSVLFRYHLKVRYLAYHTGFEHFQLYSHRVKPSSFECFLRSLFYRVLGSSLKLLIWCYFRGLLFFVVRKPRGSF